MSEWKSRKEDWANDAAQSYEYWYRQRWNIPRHDPRLEGMTPEEFEFEFLTAEAYADMIDRAQKGKPRRGKPSEAWLKRAKEIAAEQSARQAQPPPADMEDVDPEKALGGAADG